LEIRRSKHFFKKNEQETRLS